MNNKCVKIIIEAQSYEAKALADNYDKDRKYKVLSRSRPMPCKDSSKVRIYLKVIKKTQLGYQHGGGWSSPHKNGKWSKRDRINIESLMRQPY